MSRQLLAACVLGAALVAGCQGLGGAASRGGASLAGGTPPFPAGILGRTGGSGALTRAVPPLRGWVEFPPARRVQATAGDVMSAATVSLIDTNLNQTVATTLTGFNGSFTLQLGTWSPALNTPYLVDVFKGLQGNLPGFDSPRFRTIVLWNGSHWDSISTPSITVSKLTTSIAIEAGLDPGNVPAANTLRKVNVSVTPAGLNLNPQFTGHSDLEILNLATDIMTYLSNNVDPVEAVANVMPVLTAISTDSGKPNDIVTLSGLGFSPVVGGNTVTFGGAAASIALATPTKIYAFVPSNAASGSVKVATQRGTSGSLGFTVIPTGPAFSLSYAYPSTGAPGTPVTLLGFGFSTTPSANTVSFGGVNTTCSSATTNSCVTAVPAGATAGPVSFSNSQGSSNTLPFTVQSAATITSYFPTTGAPGQEIEIAGNTMGSSGSVTISGISAAISGLFPWSSTAVVAHAPAGTVTGNLVLTPAGGTAVTAGPFAILSGQIAGWSTSTSTAAGHDGGWMGRKGKYLYLGGGYTSANGSNTVTERAPINNDGTPGSWTTLAGVSQPFTWNRYACYDLAHQASIIGNYAYVYAGYDWAAGAPPNTTVLRATIFPDGSMSQFAASPVSLAADIVEQGYIMRIRNFVYVIGGYGRSTGYTDAVQTAQINPDGTLQPFSIPGRLPTRSGGGSYLHVGRYLYKLGDYNPGSGYADAANIYRAPVNADGSLGGAFTSVGSLPAHSSWGVAAVIGPYAYLFLGHEDTTYSWYAGGAPVYRALINSDDTLGGWTTVSTMPSGHIYPSIAVIGSRVYLTGNYTGSYQAGLNVATLN